MRRFILSILFLSGTFCAISQTDNKLILLNQTSLKDFGQNTIPILYERNQDIIVFADNELLMEISKKKIQVQIIDEDPVNGNYFAVSTPDQKKNFQDLSFENKIYSNQYAAIVKFFPGNSAQLLEAGYNITPLRPYYTARAMKKKYAELKTLTSLDSIIDTCLAAIKPDSIHAYMQSLEDMGTRFCLADNHREVAVWLQDKYISMGYNNTVLDSFPFSYNYNSQLYETYQYNVVATIEGNDTPDDVYIAGGHFDDIVYPYGTPLTIAPGADDNGSATAATLEIARVFKAKGVQPGPTVKFIAFGAEELGLHGSGHYAASAVSEGEQVQMMINSDMIATNSQVPGSWSMNLVNYDGCEDVTALAHHIVENYTTLNPVDVNSNSAGSDSYSFWENGFQTIFLQEQEFSPVYHTVNDLVINTDPLYCAEITKVACGMLLHAIESPSRMSGLELLDVGDGTSLKASWRSSSESDLAGYNVHVGIVSGSYGNTYSTTDTSFMVTGLTEGVEYFIGVSAYDLQGNEGLLIEDSEIPLSVPRRPEGLEQLVSSTGILLGWRKNQELDLLGYGVFRSDSPSGIFAPVLIDAVEDTVYFDNTVLDHTMYYYKISAMDSAMNQSELTDAVKARTITHDSGILIVDDSEGGWLNPSDQQVDDFYDSLCVQFQHKNYDAFDSTRITLGDMGAYSTLLWHINRKVNKPVLFKSQNEVKKFLESGGNILLTAYEPQGAMMDLNGYPYTYLPGDFIYDYFKIEQSQETDEGLFIGAIPAMAGYDSLFIDTLKVPSNNDFHVANIESIIPAAEAEAIYLYDSYFDPGSPAGNMFGMNVGVEYLGDDFKTVTVGFPLYFMKLEEARVFTEYVLNQKFGDVMNIPDKNENDENVVLHIFPNPADDHLCLEIETEASQSLNMKIFSINGDMVKDQTLNCFGGLQKQEINVSELPSGFYFLKLFSGKNSWVGRFVIMR